MNYSKYIDHTILKADASIEDVKRICKEARDYDFASVCVNPSFVSLCKEELKRSSVKVCTVVGFPLGATTTYSKVEETKQAIKDGATEIDMVINISRLKAKQDDFVEEEIRSLKKACGDLILKVIIETCLLTDEEKVRACILSKKAGADFVKTSTGFSTGGATAYDVKLMRDTVGEEMGVKASGGIKDSKSFLEMIEAGANRIGASAGIRIMQDLSK